MSPEGLSNHKTSNNKHCFINFIIFHLTLFWAFFGSCSGSFLFSSASTFFLFPTVFHLFPHFSQFNAKNNLLKTWNTFFVPLCSPLFIMTSDMKRAEFPRRVLFSKAEQVYCCNFHNIQKYFSEHWEIILCQRNLWLSRTLIVKFCKLLCGSDFSFRCFIYFIVLSLKNEKPSLICIVVN